MRSQIKNVKMQLIMPGKYYLRNLGGIWCKLFLVQKIIIGKHVRAF